MQHTSGSQTTASCSGCSTAPTATVLCQGLGCRHARLNWHHHHVPWQSHFPVSRVTCLSATISISTLLGFQPPLQSMNPSCSVGPQLGSMLLGPDFCHLLLDDKLGFTYCVLRIEKSVDYLQPLTVIWFKQRP